MRFRIVALVLASLAVLPASAFAAMVSPRSGEVRVGTGQGFQLIVAPTEVSAGAQVMVGPKGAASIAYSGNCVVTAPAATVTIVESRAPCSGNAMPAPSYFGYTQTNQEGIAIGRMTYGFTPKVDAPDETEEAPTPEPPKQTKKESPAPVFTAKKEPAPQPEPVYEEKPPADHSALLIVGAVVVGAGALAAVLASQGSDGPASP